MSAFPASTTGALPPEVYAIPEEYRIPQAFGWTPSVAGAFMLLLATMIFVGPANKPHVDHRAEAAGFAALGALFLVYEILRRRNPTVLVPVDAGAAGRQVALYLKGNFDSTFPPNQMTFYVRNLANTLGSLFVGVAFSALFIMLSLKAETLRERVMDGVAAAMAIAALASAVRTRLFCEQLILPKKTGRGRNWVLVGKNQVKQIYG